METQERICGLCLKLCDNYKAIEVDMRNVMDVVLPKINSLAIVKEPVICTLCTEMLTKCFNFKSACFCTYGYIVPFVNKNKVKLDLKEVYLSKNVNGTSVLEDQDICGFCMSPVKNCYAISLDVEEKDGMLPKMMEQCLPELDLSLIEKPVVCAPCHGSLEDYFRFVTNCLLVEEKIQEYCETMGISNRDELELSSLLQFMIRDVTSELNDNSVDIIKEEKQFYEEDEHGDERKINILGDTFKLEQMFCADSENAIKEENNQLHGIYIEETVCGENETHVKEEHFFEMKDQKFLVNEEIQIKRDEYNFNRFDDGVVLPQPEFTARLCSKRRCLIPNLEGDLSCIENTSANKNATNTTMYQCECCPSKVTMHDCDSCSYQTNCKDEINRHLLISKDPSKVTMYKCDSCSFQTKYKKSIKRHLLVHKDPSEITMFKCDSCLLQTKYERCLKKHLLIHEDSSVTMYKCTFCSYQTKRKSCFRIHKMTHKDPAEVKIYNCDSCSYRAKYKYNLKRHSLVHKDPSAATIYKCDFCSYQTTHKFYLGTHIMAHKDPAEAEIYNCDSCSFQTKRKDILKRHSLVHKDLSEVTLYKCDFCPYQTKRKFYLGTHIMVHKDPAEVEMYSCDSCSFKTKRKSNLKRHSLVHKDPSEVTMYKCDSCSYQTKDKHTLKRHLQRHKKPSKVDC